MENYNDKKVKISDFNEGFLQLQRLHNIWVKCNLCLVKGDFYNYNWNLDCAWIELAADAYDFDCALTKRKEESEEEHNKRKYFNIINLLDEKIYAEWSNKNKKFKNLKNKHVFLKLLQEKSGKGGRKSEVFADSMMLG